MCAWQLPACPTRSIDLPIRTGRDKRQREKGGEEEEEEGVLYLKWLLVLTPVAGNYTQSSPRAAADLLPRTMEAPFRAPWNLRVRPASRSSACSCGRSRESSLPPQLAPRFSSDNEKTGLLSAPLAVVSVASIFFFFFFFSPPPASSVLEETSRGG